MALNIRNSDAEKLAAELARGTDESKTEVVTEIRSASADSSLLKRTGRHLAAELEQIAEHCANLRVIDGRSAEEILGY